MRERTRPEQDILITGINPAREALKSGAMAIREALFARTDQRVLDLMELARKKGIPVRQESRDALDALAGHAHHQGAILLAGEFHYTPLEVILSKPMEEREPLVILDTVQDPQNLGAVLRSACFLGAKAVVIPKDRSARVTSTVIKVAAGATSYLPVAEVTNLVRALDDMKANGIWIAGLDVTGGRSLYDADLSVPLALVVGNEQKGLRPLVRKHCDLLVQIPARGPMESLNAATAGAVALAEIQRQRSNSSR